MLNNYLEIYNLYKTHTMSKYDYIIVGVGTAGAVLVNKLSKHYRVLGLESGKNYDANPLIRDSAVANSLEAYLWKFFWQGESTVVLNLGQSFHWPGGRLLGGDSSINGEQYVKGTVDLYRKWEAVAGPRWSPEEVFRAYKELETFHGIPNPSHGTHGPISIVQTPAIPTSLNEKVTNALSASSGIPIIIDYNDPAQALGVFTRWQLTQRPDTTRESSSTAFLGPTVMDPNGRGLNGHNFRIRFNSTVDKVLFEGTTATGVKYVQNGTTKYACAKLGVIMAAGVRSVEILMRSGIGPALGLEQAGVTPLIVQPNLGQNLVNQLLIPAIFTKNPADPTLNNPAELYAGGAFLPAPGSRLRKYELLTTGIDDNTFLIGVIDVDPKSRGNEIIQDKDPYTIPEVNFNYLQDPEDIASFATAFKTYIKALHNYFQAHPDIYAGYALVAPSVDIIDNDEALADYIRTSVVQTHHISSTARMASPELGGVVNSTGHVYGAENLIIADDCICPFINDGNTQSCAYLIGWVLSEFILEKKRSRCNKCTKCCKC
jgi:choline dehydrogenase